MREPFSGDVRRSIITAQGEAKAAGCTSIGTEHLLLAIAVGGGEASTLLHRSGAETAALRRAIASLTSSGSRALRPGNPFTPHLRRAIETAAVVAQARDKRMQISEADLLVGLLRTQEGTARRALDASGVDAPALESQALALPADPQNVSTAGEVRSGTAWYDGVRKLLRRFVGQDGSDSRRP